MDTNMTDIDVVSLDEPGDGAGEKRANIAAYLDRFPATILMIFKLVEGVSKVCAAIIGAVLVKTAVGAINQTLQQESIVADIRSMTAQLLNAAKVPADIIREVVDVIPSAINFRLSGGLVFYVFMILLPFALIAALEAIAAVRLRFGKGGTRTIGVLHWIYFAVEVIKMIAAALMAISLTAFTINSLGFTAGTFISIVYISLGIFYILVHFPVALYHREITGLMGDIGYEMQTGSRASIIIGYLKPVSIILIIFQIISTIVSIGSAVETGMNPLILSIVLGSALVILKYICVIVNYQNFIHSDQEEPTEPGSHTLLVIVVVVITLIFAAPTAILCASSGRISTTVAESVSEYVSKAKDSVDELSAEIEKEYEKQAETEKAGAVKADAAQNADAAQDAQPEQIADAAQNVDAAQNAQPEQKADAAQNADATQKTV